MSKSPKSQDVTPEVSWVHPTGKQPKTVVIIGLGPSCSDWINLTLGNNALPPLDEIWTVNMGGRVFNHDLLFAIDDVKRHEQRNPQHAKFIKTHAKPVITSQAYPDYSATHTLPIKEVVTATAGIPWFTNTVAYMLAYAIFIGVKKIFLYGADYDHPLLGPKQEPGKDCVSYWVAKAQIAGIEFDIAQSSTLIDTNRGRPLYGYMFNPFFKGEADE